MLLSFSVSPLREFLPRRTTFVSEQHFHPARNLLHLSARITIPIRRPNTVEVPSETFKNTLAESVSIARGFGGMICRAIALDRQYITAGSFRVNNRQVQKVSGHSDLRVYIEPEVSNPSRDLNLEV